MAEAPDSTPASPLVAPEGTRLVLAPPKPPSILRVVGAVLLVLLLATIGQAMLGFVLAIVLTARGVPNPAQSITELLETPAGFIPMALIFQSTMLAVFWAIASRSERDWRDEFGFRRSALSWLELAALVLGCVLAALVGTACAIFVSRFTGGNAMAEKLWSHTSWGSGVCLVLFIGIVPGIAEELFFRGYVQRRLLQRWRPAGAIVLTSVLFAAMHVDPPWAAFAFVVGLWLGLVAWRTGSVRPSMVCHGCLNGLWNIYFISATNLNVPASTLLVTLALVVPAGLIGLVVGLVALMRMTPAPLRVARENAQPIPVARPACAANGAAPRPAESSEEATAEA